MKKILLSAVIALLPITGFSATVFGFQAGGGSWKHDPSGNITASSSDVSTSADLKNGLKLAEKSEGYSYFILEHPIPLIPNLKVLNTKLSSAGTGDIDATFSVNGINYTQGTAITSTLKLDSTDITLYYELLDNDLVSFDLGLTGKKVDGKLTAVATTLAANETATFSGTIPMVYGAVEIGLPYGFALGADINWIGAGDSSITDTTFKVTYTSDYNFGIEAGIRNQTYDIDVDSVKAKMEFEGVFMGAFLKF